MPYRTILVSLNDLQNAEAMIASAAAIAQAQDAHLIGCYVVPAITIYPEMGFSTVSGVDDRRTEHYKSKLAAVREMFEAALRKNDVRGEWRAIESVHPQFAPDMLRNGSRTDLIVMSQIPSARKDEFEPDLIERLVLESGRPVLMLPQNFSWKAPDTAVVGYNGTREAARAVFDSIPLLGGIKNVMVVWVNSYKDRSEAGAVPCADVALALVRHGISATAESLSGLDSNAGETLLQKANDTGAGLLVMGAYAHSRLRQYIFGGATQHVLENAGIPVLMSH